MVSEAQRVREGGGAEGASGSMGAENLTEEDAGALLSQLSTLVHLSQHLALLPPLGLCFSLFLAVPALCPALWVPLLFSRAFPPPPKHSVVITGTISIQDCSGRCLSSPLPEAFPVLCVFYISGDACHSC